MSGSIEDALSALRRGKTILVYDSPGREGETDMVVASQFAAPEVIRAMRKDGGGLICATVPPAAWKRIGLPFMADILDHSTGEFPALAGLVPATMPYDWRSAFSVSVNHVGTFTGITDADRSATVRGLADFVSKALSAANGWDPEAFAREFRAPGHVHLLNASPGLLGERRGHTELVTALMMMAGLTPTAVICEMLGSDGKALQLEDAKEYARRHHTALLLGEEIVEAWGTWSG